LFDRVSQKHLISLFCLPLLVGCASKRVETSVEALERNQVALKTQQGELQRKMDDLANSFMVLQDRLETLKVASERQPTYPAHPSKAKPKRTPKIKSAPTEEETEEESALGFGKAGGSHLPAIQLTNRDLDTVEEKKGNAKEPSKEPDENPEAARAYNEAYKKFEEEKYPEAIRALGEFAGKYPAHVYADNAVYWVGESYFRMRDFPKAAEQFERVAKEFPSGNKVPDALLRAASCYLRMNKPLDAKQTFERIVQIYPQSVAAQKARASLAEISDGGSDSRRM
jgi:tol-pal system protein YbgF